MKNIEIIIKYLSGEMLPDEKEKFKKELSDNPELRNEFESVSPIWKEIRKQLTLQDGPESMDREEIIAEILAEHDVQFYKQDTESKREQEFRKKLEQTMNEPQNSGDERRRLNPRVISMISMAAAAAIVAFVLILNPPPDIYELTRQYYQPASDAVFESISNTSRSEMGSAMALFRQGDFETAKSLSYDEMQKYPDIGEIHLLYALSCYESGDLDEAESSLRAITQRYESKIDETARWYLALIYLKSDKNNEARQILESLVDDDVSHEKHAKKLLRKMD